MACSLLPLHSLPHSLTHSLTQQQEGCGVEWSHLNSLPDAALLCIYAFYSILPTQSFSASSIVLYSFAGRYATVPLQYCQLVTPPSPMLVHSLFHSLIHSFLISRSASEGPTKAVRPFESHESPRFQVSVHLSHNAVSCGCSTRWPVPDLTTVQNNHQ